MFHVENAVGSAIVPAQDEFVLPYAVRSVIGLGGLLSSGEIFAVILFARCPVPTAQTPLFKPLALNLRSAVLGLEQQVFA